jgi:hypothetical protein
VEQEQNFDVATQPQENLPAIPLVGLGMLTPELVNKAEEMVQYVCKIKSIALKVTNRSDWIRFGDKGYLTESGCSKIASLFGVSMEFPRKVDRKIEDRSGKAVIVFTAYCKATFNGRVVEAVGICDSEKSFYKGKDDPKPLEERDFNSMMKHAATNASNRALKAIIGFGGITWDEVEASLGHSQAGQITQVSFKRGDKATQAQTVDATSTKAEMKRMLLDMAQGDVETAKTILRDLTVTTDINPKTGQPWPPKESVDNLTDKAAATILKLKVKPAYERWQQSTLPDPFEREPGMEG